MNLDNLKVSLAPEYYFFWKYFDEHFGHEMMLSEVSRAVFPYLNYRIEGLNPDTKYSMHLHFELTSTRRYQFRDGKWSPVAKAAKHGPPKQVRHERGVLSGKDWMKGGFSFMLARISCIFESDNESEIPLHFNHKYRPVVSIREEPTPEKANPSIIQCRLKHTEFITVTDIANQHVRSLKLINKQGYMARKVMRVGAVGELPIFATCKFVNASDALIPKLVAPKLSAVPFDRHQLPIKERAGSNNQIGTAAFRKPGLQGVPSSIFNNQGEGDGTQEKNTNKKPSTLADDSAHPLSVRKLYLSTDKMGTEDPQPIQEKDIPGSIEKSCPPDLLKQLMAMQAQVAKNLETSQIPSTIVTPRISSPGDVIEQMEVEQVVEIDASQNSRERFGKPRPAVEPSRNKRLVEMEQNERNIEEEEEVIFLGEYKKPQPGVCSNRFMAYSKHHIQVSTSQTHFSAQISPPTFPSNYGHHQTPFPFPLYSQFSPNAGNTSIHMTSSMPQLPVAYPQFFSSMSPALNLHSTIPPHPFGPFPHTLNTSFPPPAQRFLFPPQHNQSTSNPRKRSFQKNM